MKVLVPQSSLTVTPCPEEPGRQEYWSEQPFPSLGDLPLPGIEPDLLHCRQILYRLRNQGTHMLLICSVFWFPKKILAQDLCLFRFPNSVYHTVFGKRTLQVFANLTNLFRLHQKGVSNAGGNGLKMFLAAEAVGAVIKPRMTTIRLHKIHPQPLCQLCKLV